MAKSKLFIYDALNTKECQFGVWGEVKEGVVMTGYDYELRLDPSTQQLYAEFSMGETIAGKLYDLDAEQLQQADVHMGTAYKRILVKGSDGKEQGFIYVKNDSVVVPLKKGKKGKKGKK